MFENVLRFNVVDYVVMGVFIVVTTGIGVYYGFIKKQTTTEEYLVGGRQLHLLPVAISLMVTYQSGISILGAPLEMYAYNTMTCYMWVAIMIANVIQAYLIVPLVYPLKLISAYEYFGRRFNSRSVQLLGTIIGMLQTLLYMSIVLLAPALALEAVAGIPLWMSVVVVGVVGTLYTSVGGIRTVIWTDVFQFVVLFGGLIVILVLGISKLGGFTKMLQVAQEGKRIDFSDVRLDPRVRHTVFGLLFGGMFNWMPNCWSQASVQRISSMKSSRDAKLSSLLNVPLVFVYGVILTFTGLMLYAYFALEECDPYLAGIVGNRNQLVPYFVMHVFQTVPGLAGVFIAALFSGALSSLSSGINSMAANTVQDLLVNVLVDVSQLKKTLVAQVTVIIYGALAIGLAYMARFMSGPVTQLAITAMGAVGGPSVGVMFLGATFPQANWIGALVGSLTGIAINVWIAVGSVLYGTKAPLSPLISTEGCSAMTGTTPLVYGSLNVTSNVTVDGLMFDTFSTTIQSVPEASLPPEHLAIYDISYMYFGMIGCIITFTVGIIVSILTGMDRGEPTDSEYIFPCLREFWKRGYVAVSQPRTYNVIRQRSPSKDRGNGFPESVAPIKALNLAWYNKQNEEEL